MSETGLNKNIANHIIKDVGGTGQPPNFGFQYFTVGLERYLNVIDEEYLKEFIKNGGSSFKMVVGSYGGGKTHFLYNIRELAWKHNYVVAYIELSGSEGAPLYRLEDVYGSIVMNLLYPLNEEKLLNGYDEVKGIDSLLKDWYYKKKEELAGSFLEPRELESEMKAYVSKSIGPYESTSFQNAIKHAFLRMNAEDEEKFGLIVQWLKGENPPKSSLKEFHVYDKIDKSNAFRMIRCLNRWIKDIGYSGLVVLMDEADQVSSLSSKQKVTLLQNLRELVDACSKGELKNSMFFYAVPDTNFLSQGNSPVFTALNMRLEKIFKTTNPNGVQIQLENIWDDSNAINMLVAIGKKLASIYEISKDCKFDADKLDRVIDETARAAYDKRFGDAGYRRLFVQNVIEEFGTLYHENGAGD